MNSALVFLHDFYERRRVFYQIVLEVSTSAFSFVKNNSFTILLQEQTLPRVWLFCIQSLTHYKDFLYSSHQNGGSMLFFVIVLIPVYWREKILVLVYLFKNFLPRTKFMLFLR